MRVGEFYVLCGLADETGLLWYETKFSKLTVKANKGVGPIAMVADWQSRAALTVGNRRLACVFKKILSVSGASTRLSVFRMFLSLSLSGATCASLCFSEFLWVSWLS